MRTSHDPTWNRPPAKLVLEVDEVHIWRASIEVSSPDYERILRLLSSDERARANRFRFARDRQRFVAARGFLRRILSGYLNCDPTKLCFSYAEHGKPFLAHCPGDLNFNLAHSGGLALYGITLRRAIGVDLEEIRYDFDTEEIAQRFFSRNEVAHLRLVPTNARARAFFECWTRKEAFIKAKGEGLSLPLSDFDVSLSPGEPASLLETRWDADESSRWSLRAIDVSPGYAATVAVEGHGWQAGYWQAATGDII
jgi:4'-phosphopantetheinyl transferase